MSDDPAPRTEIRPGPPAPNAAVLLIALGRRVGERVDARLAEHDLAYRHLSALGHLAHEPDLSYSELGRRVGVTAQSMGASIGRGVWLETYWLPESDLVRLGDGATVNRGCVVQTHLFHDRIMSMDEVRIDEGATLGPNGIILPGAGIGAGTTVGPGSLVTRGDAVPAATRWLGNPITTWR